MEDIMGNGRFLSSNIFVINRTKHYSNTGREFNKTRFYVRLYD